MPGFFLPVLTLMPFYFSVFKSQRKVILVSNVTPKTSAFCPLSLLVGLGTNSDPPPVNNINRLLLAVDIDHVSVNWVRIMVKSTT